jgi:hypothetical protein
VKPLLAAALMAVAAPAPAQLPFDPVAFFEGRTRGTGELRQVLKSPKRVTVDSVGTAQRDGTLVLRQRVEVEGDKPRERVWRLKRSGPRSFSGTLSDARGPVTAVVDGRAIHIRYRTTDGLNVQQWLTPAGDRAINNRMTFSKFGITVARLTERIEKR